MMKAVSSERMRALDRQAIEEQGVSGELLMERAGRGVADSVARIIELLGGLPPPVRCVAGGGNNGGDAFVAARCLSERGFDVDVCIATPASKISGVARVHFDKLVTAGVPVREMTKVEEWDDFAVRERYCGIVVDGLLGTGSMGAPRGAFAGAVRYINAISRGGLVVAIDLPSGMDADSGIADGDVVFADVTVTMALPKQGLLTTAAAEYVGRIEVVDIGLASDSDDVSAGGADLVSVVDVANTLPRRKCVSHKGLYGKVLVIAGSAGYSGAATLAAQGALRGGAGLVTALVPRCIANVVAASTPELMVKVAPETEYGALDSNVWNYLKHRIDEFDAVVVGPGLTRSDDIVKLMRNILRDCRVPLVVDADAIAVMEGGVNWFARCYAPLVITPHPGEMAILLTESIEEVQRDRRATARRVAELTGTTVVLKGVGTCIATNEHLLCVNMTGNPGMATAGSGDVLAGMVAVFMAQGIDPHDAACAAVFIHGRAGDRAAVRLSEAGMTAGDLLTELPYVFREICGR